MDRSIGNVKVKGIIYLIILFMMVAGSTAAWLYFGSDIPKKAPLRAKQVFLWHNNQNNAHTIIVNDHIISGG
ncbi:hypothetical protein [Sporomusa acidovorans]|uniref:Uncharacterized protein n=1 Tax=Sporomusa acidovorans (strain ATCC 49682 / DSM 3132 / Mol) TaxID=1123286 RepID=A0ABZ3J400_SPOA4|nr:hypothetical protein [Sporomusa acidovorans]OZC20338.1 hypothetical protein SPACI_27370 [Sporomusa acidovorans DSM 3132]SDD37145.1 hypothetical protein SAMN04488499_100146 [Sporomusa acidovorans]